MANDWHTEATWQRWVAEHERWLEEHGQESPRPERTIHAIAEITMRRTEDGGRDGPVRSGYRGHFHYDGHDWDAHYIFDTEDWIQPGETAEAILQFISPWAHQSSLYPGKEFLIREGSHTVGQGRITWVAEELR